MKKLISSVLLVGLLGFVAGCGANPKPTTAPLTVTQAQYAISVLNTFHDNIVSMNSQNPKLISDETKLKALQVYTVVVSIVQTAPQGWRQSAITALGELKTELPADEYGKISTYVDIIVSILNTL